MNDWMESDEAKEVYKHGFRNHRGQRHEIVDIVDMPEGSCDCPDVDDLPRDSKTITRIMQGFADEPCSLRDCFDACEAEDISERWDFCDAFSGRAKTLCQITMNVAHLRRSVSSDVCPLLFRGFRKLGMRNRAEWHRRIIACDESR